MFTTRLSRRSLLAGTGGLALPAGSGLPAHPEEGVVRSGISMADIPLTTRQPGRGALGEVDPTRMRSRPRSRRTFRPSTGSRT